MTAFYAPDPINSTQFIPGGNTPASGGLLFCYQVGSSTKQNTYTDATASTARTNPIVLDSGGNIPGNGEVWIASTAKFVLAPSNDTDPPVSPYWSRDNLPGVNDPSQVQSEWIPSGLTPTFVNGSTFVLGGDQTTTVTVGRRLRTVNTAGTFYSSASSSVFAVSTTIGIISDTTGIDSGLSAVSYGILNEINVSIPAFIQSGAGATPRLLQSKLRDSVSVKDFGAKGDGVTDDTAALTAVRSFVAGLSDPVQVYWPAGKYVYSASPNWAISNSAHQALGKVELSYTGSSNALIFDGGAAGGGVYNVKWKGNFVVSGTASATNGIFARALHHSWIEATILGTGTASAGLLTNWCVLTDFYVKVSSNEGSFVSQPANGYLLDERGAGEGTASCNFWNPITEGVSGSGIKLVNAQGNNFFGGSSEGNNRGVEIATGGSNISNKFYGLDTESNSTEDYLLNCFDNSFFGLKSSGLLHLSSTSVRNHFFGGYLNSVTIDAPGDHNAFSDLTMGNAGGSLTDNGTGTGFFNIDDATAGVFRTKIAGGVLLGGATGGDKGAGAINAATAYYLNNSLLLGAKDTSVSTGVGVIHMKSANPATNAAWIPITSADGTVYFVPGWTTNNP